MTATANAPLRILGCDVGKAEIVVFDTADGLVVTVRNHPDDLAAFAATLDETCLVICEATGGYEDDLLSALLAAGRSAHRADARKVKAFIRSYGILGKTDALDAHALARYGQERHAGLARWQAPDPTRERLQSLVLTRADLVAQRTAWGNRLAAPGVEAVRDCLQTVYDCLDAQVRLLDKTIAKTLQSSARLARAEQVLRSIAGLGRTTAAALLALMPELGQLERRKITALAGLAPHPDDSGNAKKYRRTRGGRPEIKRVLFMAAMAAARYDPILSVAYQRLKAAGKKPLVALIAIMRRIIVIANARLRDDFKNVPQLS